MASIPCNFYFQIPSPSSSSAGPSSPFLALTRRLGWFKLSKMRSKVGPETNGSRTTCWFRFGNRGVDAEGAGIYGNQTRDDFDRDDVEQVSPASDSLILGFGDLFGKLAILYPALGF
ncbi:hypothetical protein BHE74_00028806 [Ensete ventricosum]|nr:hypothetical protein BHE74_00028806 [Ensete ventricosum]